jgi:hypothetical protein
MGSKSRKKRILREHVAQNNHPIQKAMTIEEVVAMENVIGIQKQLALEKAFSSTDVATILKAENYLKSIEKRDNVDIKSVLVDPLSTSSSFGYKYKPYSLSYDMLRGMAKTHIPTATIKTRVAQVLEHCEPQSDKYRTGFIIDKRNKWRSTIKDKPLTKAEQLKADKITQFILDCGTTENFWHADTFSTFITKLVTDALTLDQGTFEVVRDRVGRPIEFFATDAATFRIADSFQNEETITDQGLVNGYAPAYVQVIDGKVYNSFFPWELCFGVMHPSTDIRTNGYGESPLERMIQLVTSLLNADSYNANFFKVGSSPQGILTYSGNVNQNTLDSFRQQWQAQVAGVANSHKIPMINADKVNFIPTHVPNKDMEFGKYQEFMIKCCCAMFLIDPSEIGFSMSGNTDGNSGLGGDATKEKLKYSKDKGLKPLLKHIQHWINKYIVWQIDPEFEFRFVGVDDAEDKATELDQDIKKVQNFMTLNEIRAKYNLDEVEGGDIVLNPIFSQQKMMAEQGNEESNNAVDGMNEGGDDEPNPFLKSLQTDLERLLS